MNYKETVISTGIPCNTYECQGVIIQRITSWTEHGEPLNPMSPSHNRSTDSCYCQSCGVKYEPDVVSEWLASGKGKITIISEDPPHEEPAEKTEKSHFGLLIPQRSFETHPDFAKILRDHGVD